MAEVCFNTGMTGYQETLTDPSYAGQIITFTFPHIGNVGANPEDIEATTPAARGLVVKQDLTEPANYRATRHLDDWLKRHGVPGIAGIDTRALTARIRDGGAAERRALLPRRRRASTCRRCSPRPPAWPGLEGMDLAKEVSCPPGLRLGRDDLGLARPGFGTQAAPKHKVVAVDYGAKRNILRCLAAAGCDVTVVPATATAEDILRHRPDGVFLSNGPGDPAATGAYAVPAIRGVLERGVPVFGICLGHQLLALALGAKTYKLDRGHRGANQPVKDLTTGKVEITSQNHGFAVDEKTLPDGVQVTHVSLFDGSNEGIAGTDRPAFSVQYHPEASPGPTRQPLPVPPLRRADREAQGQADEPMFDLRAASALVTGGNGGIGLGLARGLARAGAAVMVAGRNAAKNAAAVAELRGAGRRGRCGRGRRHRPGQRAGHGRRARSQRFGRLDILVNNAGTNIRNRPEVYTSRTGTTCSPPT